MTNIDLTASLLGDLDLDFDYDSGHCPSNTERAHALADAGLLAPAPQIIHTLEELANLDPDTLVAMNPIIKGHGTAYVWSADTALRVNLLWHGPMVIIATGAQVRAARTALQEATE